MTGSLDIHDINEHVRRARWQASPVADPATENRRRSAMMILGRVSTATRGMPVLGWAETIDLQTPGNIYRKPG
jgi:hypothetical protein